MVKEVYDDPHIILLPQICGNCFDQIKAIDQFRENCHQADGHLRGLIAEIQLMAMNTSELSSEQNHEEIEYSHSDKEIKDDPDHILSGDELELDVATDEPEMDNQLKREIHVSRTQKKGRKKSRKDYNIACEICGKTYTKGDMKFHLNAHNGNLGFVSVCLLV